MSRPAGLLPALAGMLVLAVAIGIGRFAFTPVLPMMQQDHALSISTAAWLASANYIGYFLGALSAVWLRYSPRLIIVIALTAIALTTIGMGFWHQPAVWLLLRMIAGITSAWALVFASAWVLPILAQLGQLRLGGLMFAGVGLGTSLAGIACLLFLIFTWTSDQAWIALGLLAVGCMVVLGLIQRSPVFPASPPVTPRAEAAHRSSTRSGSQGEIANQPFR
ncbi:MAG: YbfB/YjiJ family MFS transporter, partial [Candidatus Competibacteraceae bacterium]|nr:YbfB/YjiJ family MFS transporter [Candidatus Competibacteraceae bacterium]